MNTLPYKIVNISTRYLQHEGRIGFDTAALLVTNSILNISSGRFVVVNTELDLRGDEASLIVFVNVNKPLLLEASASSMTGSSFGGKITS
jgi:hypothetical protein